MNLEEILKYRKIFNNMKGRSEETVKIQVVIPLLELLGFDISWIEAEKKVKSKRNIVDLCYHLPGLKEKFYVEVKAPDVDLKDKELEQLSNYQNITNMTWGLLTNGRELILLNHKTDGHVNQKQILYINLFQNFDLHKLKYLSYNSIYISRVTIYFFYINQFKIYFKENRFEIGQESNSWKQYHSTLKTFFEYLIDEVNYLNLENIRIEDFKNYIRVGEQQRGEIYSKNAICNKYNHISSFLFTLHKNRIIIQNPFRNIGEVEALRGLDFTEKNEFTPLSDTEIGEIYNTMQSSKRNVERNILLLDIIFSVPIRTPEIANLKISDIDINNMIMQISDRQIPISKELLTSIQNYIEKRLNKGIECPYLFCSKYDEKIGKMTDSNISATINNVVNKCSFSRERKKEIDLRFIRGTVVNRYLFNYGFSTDEVMKIADCTFSTFNTYCDIEKLKDSTQIPIKKMYKSSSISFVNYRK